MCYKTDKHKQLRLKLEELTKDYPLFIKGFFSEQKSARSSYNYFGYINDMLTWLIKNNIINKKSISEITAEDLNDVAPSDITLYLSQLQTKGNMLDTINTKKNVCRSFWRYLMCEKHVTENIISLINKDRFKPEKTDIIVKIPTEEELKEFLNNIQSNNSGYSCIRNATIVELLLGSGIRSEELIGLDVQDLYLGENAYIKIMEKGKIEKQTEVMITPGAKKWLEKYLTERDKFIEGKEENALFLSNRRQRISKSALDNIFSSNSNSKIYPHMIRHYVGTMLYRKSHDIILVQTQLRHEKLETAVKYYVQNDEEKLREVLNAL